MRPRRGFTIVELLVVIAIMGMLMAILLPSVERAREQVRRTACAAHLKGLGNAMLVYAAEDAKRRWPDAGRLDGNVDTMRSMWLLIQFRQAQPDHFICPTDLALGQATGFTGAFDKDKPFPRERDRLTISYSYQVPHSMRGDPSADHPNSSRFAVMADRNPFDPPTGAPPPGGKLISSAPGFAKKTTGEEYVKFFRSLKEADLKGINSPNHRGQGQNVLYRDMHVDWHSTPLAGIDFDNIYTRGSSDADDLDGRAIGTAPDATATPASNNDSYLRTVLSEKAEPPK